MVEDLRKAIADRVRADVKLHLGANALTIAMHDQPIGLSGGEADAVADAALAGLDEAGHVVVARADLVAYLNRGTGDLFEEAAALNRLLAAAGIE
jgi:hypothetical protein